MSEIPGPPLDGNDRQVLLSAAWVRQYRPEGEIKSLANLAAYLWQYTHGEDVDMDDVRDLLSLLVEAYTDMPVWAFEGYSPEDEILNRGREVLVAQIKNFITAEVKALADPETLPDPEQLEMRMRAVAEVIIDTLNDR